MANENRADLYQEVTDRIVRDLEGGTVPWIQPWSSSPIAPSLPRNVTTRRRYSGINVLLLWMAGRTRNFQSQGWLTFRQALAAGGHVRKGEKGTTIFYADRFVPKDDANREDARSVPFLKRFSVFNAEQCENLPSAMTEPTAPLQEREAMPAAEALARATGADIRIGGDKAFFAPGPDYIQIPSRQSFRDQANFYSVLYHELGHWSGGRARLDRNLSGRFGSHDYMAEELIAELTSAFVLAELAIQPTVRHADYIGAWIAMLKTDKRAVFSAARFASAAADCILAFRTTADVEADNVAQAA